MAFLAPHLVPIGLLVDAEALFLAASVTATTNSVTHYVDHSLVTLGVFAANIVSTLFLHNVSSVVVNS